LGGEVEVIREPSPQTSTYFRFDLQSGTLQPLPDQFPSKQLARLTTSGREVILTGQEMHLLRYYRLAVFENLKEALLSVRQAKSLMELMAHCLEHYLEVRLKSFDFWNQIIDKDG
jgi:hypothetical protein